MIEVPSQVKSSQALLRAAQAQQAIDYEHGFHRDREAFYTISLAVWAGLVFRGALSNHFKKHQ